MNNDIETIVFDLGQVIIDVDFNASIRAFQALNVENATELMQDDEHVNILHQFEKGEIDTNGFRDAIRQIAGNRLPDEQIDTAWEAMLGHIPSSRLQLIHEINKIFSTFLLSNTNPIHLKAIYYYVANEHEAFSFNKIFQAEYYSFQLGMRKPDPAIFWHILNQNNLNAANTLFLDDSSEHIESAKRLGMKTIKVDKQHDLVSILNRLKADYGHV